MSAYFTCCVCGESLDCPVTVKWNPWAKKVKAAAVMEGWITEEVWGKPSENRPCILLRARKKGKRKVAVVWEIQDDGRMSCIFARINGTTFSGIKKVAEYLTGTLTEEAIQAAVVALYDQTYVDYEEWERKRREIPHRFLPKSRTRK